MYSVTFWILTFFVVVMGFDQVNVAAVCALIRFIVGFFVVYCGFQILISEAERVHKNSQGGREPTIGFRILKLKLNWTESIFIF